MSEEELKQLLKIKGIEPDVIQTMLLYKIYKKLDSAERLQHIKTNRSMRLKVDLTKAHTDEELGLEATGITYLWLTIEKADSPFTYKIKQTNQQKSGIFTGAQGAGLDQHEFTEIYVTNAVAIGEAIIAVGWRD